MKAKTARRLNLTARGRHAADPLSVPPLQVVPVTREAVVTDLAARRALTAQADMPTTVIPALAVPCPPPPPRDQWLPASQAAAMMPAVKYPDCGEEGRAPVLPTTGYAAAMRHVSRITGTSSPFEDPAAWPGRALEAGTSTPAWITQEEMTMRLPGGAA